MRKHLSKMNIYTFDVCGLPKKIMDGYQMTIDGYKHVKLSTSEASLNRSIVLQ